MDKSKSAVDLSDKEQPSDAGSTKKTEQAMNLNKSTSSTHIVRKSADLEAERRASVSSIHKPVLKKSSMPNISEVHEKQVNIIEEPDKLDKPKNTSNLRTILRSATVSAKKIIYSPAELFGSVYSEFGTEGREDDASDVEKEKNWRQMTSNKSAASGAGQMSVVSGGSQSNTARAQEIGENLSVRMFQMKWTLLALLVNTLLLVLIENLQDGLVILIPISEVHSLGGVTIEIVLLIANIITLLAMDESLAAVAGLLMSRRGLSMAVCGFAQSSSVKKFFFASQLSFNSKVRVVLNRISYFWLVMELCKILTAVVASSISGSLIRVDVSKIGCVVFSQTGIPKDRLFPTIESELGFSELVFGRSLGVVRSQYETNVTIALVGPQMAGSFISGDNIIGDGFSVQIFTNCSCLSLSHPEDMAKAGIIPEAIAYFRQQYPSLPVGTTITNVLNYTSSYIDIFTLIGGKNICGGIHTDDVPICRTRLENHFKATIEMTFMDDGNPSSIAQSDAHIRSYDGIANIDTWLASSMINLFAGSKNVHSLPSTVPGLENTLMWWTTSDLTALDPPLMEAGLETMFAILYRAAVQRSYNTKPMYCVRNQEQTDRTFVKLKKYGYQTAIVFLVIHWVVTILSLLSFVPWLLSKTPILPAVRAVHEGVYFTVLLMNSSMTENLDMMNNAPTYAIWHNLDKVVKVGEHVSSIEEDVGVIIMDKPKVVKPLKNGRRYM